MKLDGLTLYPESTVTHEGTTYFVARQANGERCLGVRGDVTGFSGGDEDSPALFPLTAANAAAMRRRLPWLNPVPLGMQTSYGFGDRLGAATPGHIAALRAADPTGQIAPIFAQQSVR
ncbi:MAG: hypothetical protein KDE59_14640, partial [Anaerolineales bacterium]|nr:hypothetical protein [Anaerolineales bacterium]